jgi:hypothetical protein
MEGFPIRTGGPAGRTNIARRRRSWVGLLVVAVIPTMLLVRAIRVLYVGRASYDPVLAAQLYVMAYGVIFLVVPTLVVTWRPGSRDLGVLSFSALAGFLLMTAVAPEVGGPNYCGLPGDLPGISLNEPVPKVFRCTETPLQVAGLLGGWWVAFWFARWRRRLRERE